jgi:hypothetical protein
MLNTLGHKGNVNKNDSEILPHSNQNSDHQEHKQQMVVMQGKRNPSILSGECKLVQPLWKSVWRFLKS